MSKKVLPLKIYQKPTLQVARELLGKMLCRKIGKKVLKGKIVEVEAYLGEKDPASHSYHGQTKRNSAMFEPQGRAYVYFTYGNHYCVNVVTGKAGKGEAILIRAVEPLEGISQMERRRKTKNKKNLCSGPGKLTQAFQIDLKLNQESLRGKKLWIEKSTVQAKPKIKKTTRIGISKGKSLPYRFIVKDSIFVSK